MSTPKRNIDWEAVEREYRAGQLSIREIARAHGVSESFIRKKAKEQGWERALAERVRTAVRERLARGDGAQGGAHPQRASDDEVVAAAASRGFGVVTSHRRDLEQLHGIKRVIADRLATYLNGGEPDGPCLGDRESVGDLLEKLARVNARLIPLERQAHNLDDDAPDAGRPTARVRFDLSRMSDEELEACRVLASAAERDREGK
ncbi:hypothetical protein [Pseudochelatococcus contaminans]|uniref:Transposase-like protein n=1 Tax=Pseudochelatococcus contaminans TaxID=1538103 RepID=A0A7W5Z2G5_9HYPH|nr:hypothetical protein [Pseudochelatococcus contaminans]MBB3808769.1 transposase-like protein [Pseudochelatococcus contaminans]